MSAKPEEFLSRKATVNNASTAVFPGSRKIHVAGSRADIRVPMREIGLDDTHTADGAEQNPPVVVYDTSGPYTDPAVTIDIRRGLPALRQADRDGRRGRGGGRRCSACERYCRSRAPVSRIGRADT